ncbi:hypothetical protein [Nocardia sp. CA-120079]
MTQLDSARPECGAERTGALVWLGAANPLRSAIGAAAAYSIQLD